MTDFKADKIAKKYGYWLQEIKIIYHEWDNKGWLIVRFDWNPDPASAGEIHQTKQAAVESILERQKRKTDAEKIIEWIRAGVSVTDIAKEMGIVRETVYTKLRRVNTTPAQIIEKSIEEFGRLQRNARNEQKQ